MIYTIAAASGTGKTSLVQALVASLDNIIPSVSHTTRPKRPNERNGENYFFVSKTKFEAMITNNEFLEYAQVFDNYYGTSRKWVEIQIDNGVDVILEIDWQGVQQVKKLKLASINIFILPPSIEALRQRLILRNQDPKQIIGQRIAAAYEEISHYVASDYIVVNDKFDMTLVDLRSIIRSQRLLKKAQIINQQKLLADLTQNR